MNWEMLAAVGQLAAVFVGIPSLIYLALQIRAQTRERRQSAVNTLTAQMGRADESASRQRRILRHFSAGLAVFRRSRRYFETQVQRLLYRFFKNFQAMYYSHCDGVLGADSWGEIGRTMADFIAYPGLEQWWKTRRHTGTPKNLPESWMRLLREAQSRQPTQPTI